MEASTKPRVVFAALVLFGIAATYLAISIGAGGHGSYLPAKMLFPYTMLLAIPQGPISLPGMALALLQYPAYGIAVTLSMGRGRGSHAFGALCAVHAVAAATAIALVPKDVFP